MALKALGSGSTAQESISNAANTSIFTHNTSTYAVVTKNQTGQGTGGFVVLDISDPDNPTIVSEITDSTTGTNDDANNDWELLNGALDVETVVIGGVPYAIIAQRLDTTASAGGFTVIKLTDSSGNITSSSPSVIKQVQDGEAFAGSLNAALSNVAAISTETIGSTTYLFTIGTNSADKGTFQVYDLNKLISNDNTALIEEKIDNGGYYQLDNPRDLDTFQKDNIIYANVTAEGDDDHRSYMMELSFDPSTGISRNRLWEDDGIDMTASGHVTDNANTFFAISGKDSTTSPFIMSITLFQPTLAMLQT